MLNLRLVDPASYREPSGTVHEWTMLLHDVEVGLGGSTGICEIGVSVCLAWMRLV